MKVTRDFFTDRGTCADVYEWRVEIDGQQYAVQERVSQRDMQFKNIPIIELERHAQLKIMRAIQEKLFGDRAL